MQRPVDHRAVSRPCSSTGGLHLVAAVLRAAPLDTGSDTGAATASARRSSAAVESSPVRERRGGCIGSGAVCALLHAAGLTRGSFFKLLVVTVLFTPVRHCCKRRDSHEPYPLHAFQGASLSATRARRANLWPGVAVEAVRKCPRGCLDHARHRRRAATCAGGAVSSRGTRSFSTSVVVFSRLRHMQTRHAAPCS